jgi:hypothetical protein
MSPEHDNKHPPHHHLTAGRAFNTPEHAIKAVATARSAIRSLSPGRVWTKKTPHGDLELKGSLVFEHQAVLALHFSAEDGSLLPKGLHAMGEGKPEIKSIVEASLHKLPADLEALDGAEFREPESCWAVPVAYRNRIVGHLKVSADGGQIIPDRKAVED